MESIELYPGIVYKLPKRPPLKEIRGYDLPKKKQKWSRIDMPERLMGLERYEIDALFNEDEEIQRFIKEDDLRCETGMWFMNNGVPTYITGDHYFYLNWFKLDIGYPYYFDKDRRWFYFHDFCVKDPNCYGSLYAKKRRDGFSYRMMAIFLNHARKTFNGNYGMMSKTGGDAEELFAKIVYGYQRLPEFYKPQAYESEDVKNNLYFNEPKRKITHKTKTIRRGISLNTKISWKNTKENSYDGFKLKRLGGDEIGKFEEVKLEKWLAIAKTTLTEGVKITGKGVFGSTVNEAKKGGADFKKVWMNSDYRELDANGQTVSGFFRMFIPVYDGLEGFIDEYGNSVIDTPEEPVIGIDGAIITMGARQYKQNRRDALYNSGDMVGYYEECRQFPFNEQELFLEEAGVKNPFNLHNLNRHIAHNETLIAVNPALLRRGNFEWVGGVKDGTVEFVDEPNRGKFLVAWMPEVKDRNNKNLIGGKPAPGNKHIGLLSIDPFDHKRTSSNKQSKVGAHGWMKPSTVYPEWSEMPVFEYFCRPDPIEMAEDMIKACVFYGWEILGENNKPGTMNLMDGRGYGNYLAERPAFTHTEWSREHQKEKWLPTTGQSIRSQMVDYKTSYINRNIGPSMEGRYKNFLFNETLANYRDFDQNDWTDFDLTVSGMVGCLGMQSYTPPKMESKPVAIFQMYDNRGMVSKPYQPKQ